MIDSIKQQSDSQRVLTVLQETPNEWVADLYQRCACMVHSRIADLRKKGLIIECRKFGQNDYRYRLVTN